MKIKDLEYLIVLNINRKYKHIYIYRKTIQVYETV